MIHKNIWSFHHQKRSFIVSEEEKSKVILAAVKGLGLLLFLKHTETLSRGSVSLFSCCAFLWLFKI